MPDQVSSQLVKFDPLIAICAFRYALGRMTYMPSHVAEYLIQHAELLNAHDQSLICREIAEAIETGRAGHDCDAQTWANMSAEMAKHLAAARE